MERSFRVASPARLAPRLSQCKPAPRRRLCGPLSRNCRAKKQPRNLYAGLCFDSYANIEDQVLPLDGIAQRLARASLRVKILQGKPPLRTELPVELSHEEIRPVIQPGTRVKVEAPRDARNRPIGGRIEIPRREVDPDIAPVLTGHKRMNIICANCGHRKREQERQKT